MSKVNVLGKNQIINASRFQKIRGSETDLVFINKTIATLLFGLILTIVSDFVNGISFVVSNKIT